MGELVQIGQAIRLPRGTLAGQKFDAADAVRLLELSAAADNAREGTLAGYDCRECRNKGYTVEIRQGQRVTLECACMRKRQSLKRIAESGLERMLSACTLESYEARAGWQQHLKTAAIDYLRNGGTHWFAILGQTGAGKTHLCTAICGVLLERGREVRYVSWTGFVRKMERLRYRDEEREAYYRPIERAQVLYLDDLLKREQGDFALAAAFELMDAREKAGRVTLLSGEMQIAQIAKLDAALASRIQQMCGKYCLEVGNDPGRNWRTSK